MTTREDIMNALLTVAASVTWSGGATWAVAPSRRMALPKQVPDQPALKQVGHAEQSRQTGGQDYATRHMVKWYVYHKASGDPASVPETEVNLILDAIYKALCA